MTLAPAANGLEFQRQAIEAAIPPDPTAELRTAEIRLATLQRARRDLETGRGRYADTAQGEAARSFTTARTRRREAERFAETADSRRTRRNWKHDAQGWAEREVKALKTFDDVVVPEAARVDLRISEASGAVEELRQRHQDRTAWLREHPEATAGLDIVERELNPLSGMPDIHQELSRLLAPGREPQVHPGIDHGPDLGVDIGL